MKKMISLIMLSFLGFTSCISDDEVFLGCTLEVLDVTPSGENYTFRIKNGNVGGLLLSVVVEYIKDGEVIGEGSAVHPGANANEIVEFTTSLKEENEGSITGFDCMRYDVVLNGLASVCIKEGTTCD